MPKKRKSKNEAIDDEQVRQEYLMLKQEIQLAIQRQDQYFLLIFSVLGIGSIIDSYITNIIFLIFMLITAIFIQLKIIECRTIVIYTATYMMVFLEKKTGFMFENRFNAIRLNFWKGRHINLIEENRVVHSFRKFGYFIKNSIIFWMALFVYIRIIENVVSFNNIKLIVIFSISTFLMLLNLIFSLMLINDRKLQKIYLENWSKLNAEE